MNKFQLLTAAILLSVCSLSYSQSLLEGYVVITSGDTLAGFIEDIGVGRNPANVSFKKNKTDVDFTNYSPGLLRSFHLKVADESYLSAEVDIDMKPIETNQLEKDDRYPKFIKEKVFLKTLVTGKASLYFFSDKTNKQHYFLQFDQMEIKELQLIKYIYSARSVQVTSEIYKEQLKQTLTGCNKGYMNVYYTEPSLKKAIQSYNVCIGSAAGYGEKKASNKLTPYAVFGVSVASGRYSGTDLYSGFFTNSTASDVDFGVSVSPYLGFGIESFTSAGKFSFALEANWRSHSFTGQTKVSADTRYAELAFSVIRLNTMVAYNFGGVKVKPFLRVGPSLAFIIERQNHMTYTVDRPTGLLTTYSGAINSGFFKTGIGAIGSVGINYSNMIMELRYEIMPAASQEGTFHMTDISLAVGYRFNNE